MAKDTKNRILETSLRLFAEKGYFDTSTKDIASSSGVGEATLFRHFTDKSNLYQEVVNTYGSFKVPQLQQLEDRLTYSDLEQDLYHMAEIYFQITFNHLYILRIFVGKISNTPELEKGRFCMLPQLTDHLKDYLNKMMKKDLISSKEFAIEIELFVSHITRLVLDISVHEHIYEMTDEIRERLDHISRQTAHFFASEVFV